MTPDVVEKSIRSFVRRLCPARGHDPNARRRETLHRRGHEKGRDQSTNPVVCNAEAWYA